MVPVHIPTKPYIKEWLKINTNEGKISRNDFVGAVIMNLLKRDTDPRGSVSVTYTESITLYISKAECIRQGGWLNITETMQFNRMLSKIIRREIRTYIHTYLHFDPRLVKAIEYAREQTGLVDCDILTQDAIIKDFQRDRQNNGGVHIYKTIPTK